jgi:DNA-binding MarR family transcriptional regulator
MNAGRRIHAAVDAIDCLVSARLGINRNDLRCLNFLEQGAATPGDVALHTGLTSGSVTALIDRLEGAGFVERRRTCVDRRSVEIVIPDARLAAIRRLQFEIETLIRAYFVGLPLGEVVETAKALGTFVAALDHLIAHFPDRADDPAN